MDRPYFLLISVDSHTSRKCLKSKNSTVFVQSRCTKTVVRNVVKFVRSFPELTERLAICWLDVLLFKSLISNSFNPSIKESTMKIYRLEHRERGCGPYDGVSKNFTRLSHRRIISMADSCMLSAMPDSDKMLTTWEPRHISERLPGSEKFFFGVKSLESLFKWFNRPFYRCVNVRWSIFCPLYDEKVPTNETILQMLILIGFVIREYEVEETSEVYLEPDDGVQVVFKKENAVRVRTLS